VGTPCHTAHVNPIVHFCPDCLQHVPVCGCHSGDDALDLIQCEFFLWGYVKDVVYISPLPNDLQVVVVVYLTTLFSASQTI
jgi:hypothetical protein